MCPLPRDHSARQIAPADCDEIRRENNKFGQGISVNWCVRPGRPVAVQSIHFAADRFTEEQARKWLSDHGYSAKNFVPASRGSTESAYDASDDCPGPDPYEDCPQADCPMRARERGGPVGGRARGAGVLAAGAALRCAGAGAFEVLAEAAPEAGPARLALTAYTGVPMRLEGYAYPVVVDLESLQVPRQQVPLLRAHDPGRIAGHTTEVSVTPRRIRNLAVLSGLPEHTDEVVATAKRGFPWQVSVGAATTRKMEFVPQGEAAKVNGRNWDGPLLVARGAVLREVSLLPLGADGNTTAAVAEALADIIASASALDIRAFHHNSVVTDGEPDWGSVDKAELPALAFADHSGQQSEWSFPHHWVKDAGGKDDQGNWTTGTLYLHKGGLNAAWSAAQGGRSGQKASQAVIDHLQAHRAALGLDKGD